MVASMLVNVHMVTYNHENYIAKAIEGVMKQKTNFNYLLIIGDDYSTDNTRDICMGYKEKFPDKIKLLFHQQNLGGGGKLNSMAVFEECKGKYIAMCEGDDYWIDENKLQKQVDFLEAREDYAICFHRVYELVEGKELELSTLNTSLNPETYTIEDLAKSNFIHTPSVVFRNGLITNLPAWFKDCAVGDYVVNMLYAEHGKIKYLPDAMAVYRSNIGVWSTQTRQFRSRNWITVLNFLIDHFDKPGVLENLINQQINIFRYLASENDPIFLNKNYLVYKGLLDMLNEKEAEVSSLKDGASLPANFNGSVLLKALVKKTRQRILGDKAQ